MWVSKLLCAVILWLRPKKDRMRNRKRLAFGEMKRISPNRQYEQHICCSQTFSGWQKKLEKTMKSSWPLHFYQLSVVCFLCALKSKQTPRSCTKHLDKDTTKARNTAPFVCGKAWFYLRRLPWRKLFQTLSTDWKPCCNGRLLLRLHHAVCKWHALQLLPLAVTSVHVFGADDHSHAFTV